MHQTLYRYHPAEGGRWKATQNDIVERAPDGAILRVRFRSMSPVATPGAMDELAASWGRAMDVRDLRDTGVLKVEGRGRGARWIKLGEPGPGAR